MLRRSTFKALLPLCRAYLDYRLSLRDLCCILNRRVLTYTHVHAAEEALSSQGEEDPVPRSFLVIANSACAFSNDPLFL